MDIPEDINECRWLGHLFATAGTGLSTASWTFSFTMPETSTYDILAYWSAYSNRVTNAPYTITQNNVKIATVIMDQKINGTGYPSLGIFTITGGATPEVTLSNNANGYIIAEAMRLTL